MVNEIQSPTFLIVSDNPAIRFWFKKHLDDRFFIIQASNRQQAFSSLHTKLDFILVDSEIENALALCKELSLRTQKWMVPIWLITGRLKKSFRDEAKTAGVSGFLSDQLDLNELENLLAKAEKQAASRQKTQNLALSIKMPVARGISLKDKFVLDDQALRTLAKAKEEKLPMALILMRIDGFEKESEKEKILPKFSQFINSLLREKDLLLPASDGGFILLLFNTKIESAKIVAVRLQEKIRKQRFQIGVQIKHLTASMAVSSLEASQKGFDKMLDSAAKSLKAHTENNLIISIDDTKAS